MISFHDMGLEGPILKAVDELGFTQATPVQELVIPHILEKEGDLIALAQTGTGKTAAFGIPLVQQATPHGRDVEALILCPTRELCIQVCKDIENFSKHSEGIRVVPVYGGASVEVQLKALQRGAQIVVGTPGRVLDLVNRRKLRVETLRWLVLDEADEMLNMGFKEDLDAILALSPNDKRSLIFSATMPSEIRRIAHKYLRDPEEIAIGRKNAGAENVRHEYYVAHARDRYEVLKRIADMNPAIYGIVFCRTRQETKDVASKFMGDGYNADALHGDLSQAQRDEVMRRFRNRHIQMLVATDVAARGLDVDDLSHVINYNLPDDLEVYIHRSGRTGRAGKSGVSVSIVHMRELNKVRDLERMSGKEFQREAIPTGEQICRKQLFNLIDRVEKVEPSVGQIDGMLPEIYKKLSWLSREDLIRHFVSVEFNRFADYYKDAADLNVDVGHNMQKRQAREQGFDRKKRNKEFTRFFINLGLKNGITPTRLIGLVNDQTRTKDIEVGRIELLRKFSFFEIEKSHEQTVLKAFEKDAWYEDVRLEVNVSRPDFKGETARNDFQRPYKGKGGKKQKRKP